MSASERPVVEVHVFDLQLAQELDKQTVATRRPRPQEVAYTAGEQIRFPQGIGDPSQTATRFLVVGTLSFTRRLIQAVFGKNTNVAYVDKPTRIAVPSKIGVLS